MPNFSIPLSGLNASSAALATTANNLANLNTVGYKEQQTQFADLFYQNLGSDGAGDPIQQGAGVKVSSQPSNFTQGNVTATGVDTNVAINGNGFFIVEQNGAQSYTRAGNFEVGTDNLLETVDGQKVLGYQAVNGVVTAGGGLGTLALGAGTVSPASATANVSMTSNLDATATVGTTYSSQITINDSLGATHQITFTYTKTATNTWDYSVTIPAADLGGAATAAPVVLATGTLTFDGNGALVTPATNPAAIPIPPVPAVTIPPTPPGSFADGANPLAFTWDMYDKNKVPLLTQDAAASSTASIEQDGSASGTLVNFSIGADGTISGSFSNGKTAAVGQIALASFADVQGLSRDGANDFSPTLASGQPAIGVPTSGVLGNISGGALEQSNVDIATEFAHLIVAQRSYEANARVVTTFDQVTQDTIALKQ
jgi:flagellar hook protein FlgE